MVSNPPYVPTAVMAGIPREVADFEPTLALDGGADGLDLFRPLGGQWAARALKPGGVLACELHEGHMDAARAVAEARRILRLPHRGRPRRSPPRACGETLGRTTLMALENLRETLDAAQAMMGERLGAFRPEVGLILGSGLGSLAERIADPISIPFGEVPGMGVSTANGHVGRFVAGELGGKCVLAMQGRLHGYEGYTAQEVAFPVWLMARLGAATLATTNAAGAINESFRVGDFCIMTDQLNFTGRNPVTGTEPDAMAPRFFSMLDAYDPSLCQLARQTAEALAIPVQEGVYLGLLGPSFETPAEIRMFRAWGADTVAMSVCEEVIAARHVGMRVLGISLVSNMACGVEGASPSDEEVHEVAQTREADFCRLLEGICRRCSRSLESTFARFGQMMLRMSSRQRKDIRRVAIIYELG